MRSQKLLLFTVLMALFFSVNAQTKLQYGTVEYWDAMRIAYQSKIDWVKNNPEQNAIAIQNNWYTMANANVQKTLQYKKLASKSRNGIYSQNRTAKSGGELCSDSAPFAAGDSENTFPCGTSGHSAENGPDYGCLERQPNPAWYSMHIKKGGDILMSLSAEKDIDFIVWGPFEGECGDGICDYTLLDQDHIVDCSYNVSSEETPEILNAVEGAIYMFLITNYSGEEQDFTLTQTNSNDPDAGLSNADCINCLLSSGSLEVTVGDCEAHQDGDNYYSDYDLSGSVDINHSDDSSLDSISWTLDNNWFASETKPLNPTISFDLEDLSSDGNEHTITVTLYFQDEGVTNSCEQTITYTAPENCAVCSAVAGPNITDCGNNLAMKARINEGDYNTSWTTFCSNINFEDKTNPNSQVSYTGTYTNGEAVTCHVIWTITNYLNLTCSDTTIITFQPTPSADFYITEEICDGLTDTAIINNNENIPISDYNWTFSNATEQTGTLNDTIILLHQDAVGNNQVCLTVTSDLGCTSTEICNSTKIKQVPTCDFSIGGSICSGGTTSLNYLNNNTPSISCLGNLNWTIDNNITETVVDDCSFDITAENTGSDPVYYNISLQVTLDGCSSDLCEDSLAVFPTGQPNCCVAPTTSAGENVEVCSFEYNLDASLDGSGNHGQWIYISGPAVTFVNNDAGTESTPGNPKAHIKVDEAGTLTLKWKEMNGLCSSEDEVEITFLDQPQVTSAEPDGYSICGQSIDVEALSTIAGTEFQWINVCAPTTTISNENIYNPTISATDYLDCIFKVVGTVGGKCRDTALVKVSFSAPPVADAGIDHSSCGMSDTLHANITYGGYWSVDTKPTGGIAVFSNHITGVSDIYDPLAVVSVTVAGEWIFTWHEVNGQCVDSENVTIQFGDNSVILPSLNSPKTCLNYTQVHLDTTGYTGVDNVWLWAVNPDWEYINDIPVTFDPNLPMTFVYQDFPESAFGDSGKITIPMIATLMHNDCASTALSSITFYQSPKPYLGKDTMVCSNQINFDITPTIPSAFSAVSWNEAGYLATPNDNYTSIISANYGDSLNIIFSEENTLGSNGTDCIIKDTILVEFLKRPSPNAGDPYYHICGNCIELEASLDNTVNSIGRWVNNDDGFFGYSCGDNNPDAITDPNAWFHHTTTFNPGVDTVKLQWMEFNIKSSECYAVKTLPVYFWFKDTAYIKINGSNNLIDSICGQTYTHISANDYMPSNPHSRGTWVSTSGLVEWYKDGSLNAHESLLDSIKISSINDSYEWGDIYWVIENGNIFGDPIDGVSQAVCVDTSKTVHIRFDHTVVADILESYSYPKPLINCGDTLQLHAGSVDEWTKLQWTPNDYSYIEYGTDNDNADTLPNPTVIAPSNIYPNSDTITGGNTYETMYLYAHNKTCNDIDTINITWAPIPTGAFTIKRPSCANTNAVLIANRDEDSGFDKYITNIEWIFESNDQPTEITSNNSTLDTINVWWGNSAKNEDYAHAVSLKTTNTWGCTYEISPADTVFEPTPPFVKWIDSRDPICGECDGLLSFKNYSGETTSPIAYSVKWATNPYFNNSTSLIIQPEETVELQELCTNDYYLLVPYTTDLGNSCSDTLTFDLNVDSSTIAESSFKFLVDTTDLQAPFELDATTIENTSINSNKHDWQIYNGTKEDLAMLIWEGEGTIPDYIFKNMGEYLITLHAYNDNAPNCPTAPVDATIFVHYESVLEVPNIFTPNNDGYNDEFRVKTRELTSYKCTIYNRWGQKVFETEDVEENWNGKRMNEGGDLSAGSYYYIITGTGKKGQEFQFKGSIQLLRDKQ